MLLLDDGWQNKIIARFREQESKGRMEWELVMVQWSCGVDMVKGEG